MLLIGAVGLRALPHFLNLLTGTTMTRDQPAHAEPSRDSTDDVDEFLRHAQRIVDVTKGAGSPALEPAKDRRDGGRPADGTPNGRGSEAPDQGPQGHRGADRADAPGRMITPETLAAATRVAHHRARRSMPSAGSAAQQPAASNRTQPQEPRGEVAAMPGVTAMASSGAPQAFLPPADPPSQPGRMP
jgi:hypothetical protein